MDIQRIENIRGAAHPNLLWLHLHAGDGLVGLGETFYIPGGGGGLGVTLRPEFLDSPDVTRRFSN